MSEIVLNANRREPGRSAARAMRREGVVPGIYYHHGEEPIAISATELALRPLIYTTESHVVRIKLDNGDEKTGVLKEVVFDPISDRPVHFDMLGIAAGEKMRVEVPVVLKGSAKGAREGGLVQFMLHKIEVECLPKDLPEHIEIEISELMIGDSIHVSDISVDNVVVLSSGESAIVSVTAPKLAAAEEEAEGEESAEPEVIARGKADEE